MGFHRAWADSNQRGGTRTRYKRACCASSRERERARAVAFFHLLTCASKLLVGGRGWITRARPCTEGEGRLAGAVGFHRAWAEPNQRGAARTRFKHACCASSRERERERAQWRYFPCAHAQVSCSLEAAAGMPEHGCSPRERAVSLAQWALIGHKPTPASAAGRARAASARAALPPEERERAQWRFFT